MTPDAKTKFNDAMRNTLKDPFSARYRGVLVHRDKQGDYVFCGYINSKNSFGAYTGERLFIAMTEGSIAEASLSDGQLIADNNIRKLCGKHGLCFN